MSKDPAFLFYSSDFLTGAMFLTDEQTGKFIRLLCVQHQKGRLREKDMLKICKTYDEDVFEMFTKDDENLFYNERLEAEVNKRKAYSESRRKNRKNKTTPLKNTSLTYVKHMENENENRNVNEVENTTELYPGFEDFWILYDKKKGSKKIAEKKWQKLPYKTKVEIMEYLPAYIASTPDKVYRKNPETFFNQESWHDEIIYKTNNNGTNQKITDRYSNLKQSVLEDIQSS
jgi:hypothetical protein